MNIPLQRLSNQALIGRKFDTPKQVIQYLSAMQAQDFPAAKWSLGLRMKKTNNRNVSRAYDNGEILRTHIMRPTWHFVLPENLVWMQNLTAHRVARLTSYYEKNLGLDGQVFQKASHTIEKNLNKEKFLTRQEIKHILEVSGQKTNGQQMGHLMSWAERTNLVTSGPMKGKQFSYALVRDRIKKSKQISKEEALENLTFSYFSSHGPAQIKDFSWWSGLTIKEVSEGISMIKSKLLTETISGKKYYFTKLAKESESIQKIFLLSVYDEYVIGYTDRSDIIDERHKKALPIGNALLTSLLIIDGRVEGTWKRKFNKDTTEFYIIPFKNLTLEEKNEIEMEANKYAMFFNYEKVLVNYGN